nr:hypothetical protein [Sphingomonas formosensis]
MAGQSAADRAAAGEAKLAKALQGRVAGKPVSCINLRDIDSSEIIDGTAILYKVGSTTYVNRPKIGADSLRWDPILVTDTHSSQLCSIDTVKLIDRSSHFYQGFVGLGDFVPYRKPS